MTGYEAPGRRLMACRYPTVEAATSSWERLSHWFAANKSAAITTMRCIGSSDEGETHMVVATGYSEEDADLLVDAPWGDGERCEADIPELIAKRLYARSARNAAALAAAGERGTFTTRRPAGVGLRFDASGAYGPERRLYG